MRKIEILIVDSPIQALQFLKKKLISSGKWPLSLKLLHFSSYCDLQMPEVSDPKSRSSFKRSSWIMDSALNDLCDHCFWIHPYGIKNINERLTSNYFIGQNRSETKYITDIPEPYYYLQGYFSCSNHIKNRKKISLTSFPFHKLLTNCPTCSEITISLLNQPFYVHIDLSLLSNQELCHFNHIPAYNEILRLYSCPKIPHINPDSCSNDEDFIEHCLKLAQVINDYRWQHLENLKQCIQNLITCTPSATLEDPHYAQEISDLCTILMYYIKLIQCLLKDDQRLIAAYDFISLARFSASAKIDSKMKSLIPNLRNFDQSSHPNTSKDFLERIANYLHGCFTDIANPYILPYFEQRVPEVESKFASTSTSALVPPPSTEEPITSKAKEMKSNCGYLSSSDSEVEQNISKNGTPEEKLVFRRNKITKVYIESILNRLHNPELIILSRDSPEYSSSLAQLAHLAGTSPPCSLNAPPTAKNRYAPVKHQNTFLKILKRVYGSEALIINLAYEDSEADKQYLELEGFQVRQCPQLILRNECTLFGHFGLGIRNSRKDLEKDLLRNPVIDSKDI